tara:strand:+ start:2249 stop:3091 length:843 start_codon:yes stop_codon:yes gene_type:complete
MSVFAPETRAAFAAAYPNDHACLAHGLHEHALLEREALARLGETLPERSVEFNAAKLPVGIAADDVPETGLTIGETIRTIDTACNWAVLKNVEQVPEYAALLHDLLEELRAPIEAATGPMLKTEAYIFVSSPGAVTPFHFDPEHNILLQVRGHKTFHVFPAGDPRFAPPTEHERYHAGGHRNLPWQDGFAECGTQEELEPGDAIYVPVMAPHYVRNGDRPSISLSITWRSRWSIDEARAHSLNHWLRSLGATPNAPNRFPQRNGTKSLAYRIGKRTGVMG